MVKNKDMQFCMENLKMKRKSKKKKLPPGDGVRTPDFLIIPAHDLNFHRRQG